MIFRFHNGRIALPGGAVEAADIAVADGTLTAISNAGDAPAEREIDLEGGWLLPGFVDTQVNGGGGVLFNDQVDVDAIAAIGAAHARFEIGRASCRERVCQYGEISVVAGTLKKHKTEQIRIT